MGKEFLRKRYVSVLCSLAIMIGLPFSLAAEVISAEREITWNLSLWGGRRAWTGPLHEWAADMDRKTGGCWKIKLHYGGVLAPSKEQLEGIKAGMFEAAGICCAYTPGKVPLHTVHELPFIAPTENREIFRMVVELWKQPALRKELLKWNAVPLLATGLPQHHLMGNRPIRTVEDLDGARIAIRGDTGAVLEEFGAVPTMIPGPEVYGALSRGIIDLAAFQWTQAYGTFRMYEVSHYVSIPVSLGTMSCFFVANKDAWDALPEEFRQYHLDWYDRAPEVWAAEYKKADDKWIPIFENHLEFIDFPVSERNKIAAKAEAYYEKWVAAREQQGLPGRDILGHYLRKRKELVGY